MCANVRKIDKRTIEVEKKIRHALIDLAKEGKKLTVINLAERCGISRNTFYLHYQSVKDVYLDLRNLITLEIVNNISKYDIKDLIETPEIFAKILIDVATRNINYVEYFFQTRSLADLTIYLISKCSDYIVLKYKECYDCDCAKDSIKFYVGGIVYMLYSWYKENPLEDSNYLLERIHKVLNK